MAAEKHINHAVLVAQATKSIPQFPSKQKHPANKAITPQKAFFSTKRKTPTTNVRLVKPTQGQAQKIKSDLLHAMDLKMYAEDTESFHDKTVGKLNTHNHYQMCRCKYIAICEDKIYAKPTYPE